MTGKARIGPTCISPSSYSSHASYTKAWACRLSRRYTSRSGPPCSSSAPQDRGPVEPVSRGPRRERPCPRPGVSRTRPPRRPPRRRGRSSALPSCRWCQVPRSVPGSGPLRSLPRGCCRRLRSCPRLRLLYERRQVFWHRRYLAPLDADLALPVLLDYKVDLAELLVRPVEVQSPLGTAALLALQGGPDDDLRDLNQVAYVLGRVPARVEEPGPRNAYLRQPVLEREYLAQALLEGVSVAHQVRMLHHSLLELLLDQVRALAYFFLLQRLEHTPDLVQHLALIYLRRMHALLDVRCGALAGPTTEDEEIGERVAPKAVRAVQTTGDLAGGEEPGHAGGSTLGVDLDPTHRVVDGWEDLHRLAGDVYVGEFEKLLVHGRQLLHDPFVAEVRDIQVDPAVLAAAALLYLCVVGSSHHVARGEFHLLGVVVLHVPHTLGVAEKSSLAAHPLGDEQTAHAWRPDHPGRMELHHLHVHQLGSCVVAEDHAVPRSLPGVGGDLEDASPPTCRHDDSLGLEVDELAALTRVG